MSNFPTILKELRAKHNLTQEKLAEALGVAKSTISMYEVGLRAPDFETEEAIADFFNVDLNYLRGRDAKNFSVTLHDDGEKEILSIFSRLSSENQSKLLELSRLYLTSQHNNLEKQ